MQKPLVSIVILSWNTKKETGDCLESVRKLKYPNKEIIVVDNGSSDGSKDYLSQLKDIVYINLPKNAGFTGGQLVAFENAKGKYVALINSDAVVDEDWLSIAVATIQSDKSIGAVGGRAYNWQDDQKPHDIDNNFYSYQIVNPYRGYATTLNTGEKQVEVDSISGAGVLISRAAIEKVGYFDNRFFAYFEETDLFARMIRAGYKIVYESSMHTWHKIAQSTKDKPFFYLYHMHRNRFMYAMKNFDKKYARNFFWFYLADGLRASVRYARTRDIDNKARTKSLAWNLRHLPETLSARRKIMKTGPTYTKEILKHHAADDITVIIPCHNYEEYVAEAINSVLAQTLKPQRIIVIDDGSTDNSRGIVRKYKDKGVELVEKPNGGVVSTKNLGIKLSTTSWTVFLDADDILEPDYLEMVYKRSASGNFDIVYTDMKYFGAKDEVLKAGSYNFNRFIGTGNFVHNSALISTHLLKQVGGYKNVMKGGYEDWELYITLAEAGASFGYVAKPLLRYRQHGQHSSRNVNAEAEAKRLWKMVQDLHRHSFTQYNFSFHRIWKMIARTTQNPFLPLVAIAVLPLCLLAAIKAFFVSLFNLTEYGSLGKRKPRISFSVIPILFINAVKAFFVTFGKRFAYRVRNYLHGKDEVERKQHEREDLLWPEQPREY